MQRCSRDLLSRDEGPDAETRRRSDRAAPAAGRVKALLKRRDRIVARIDTLVKERGENLVLY